MPKIERILLVCTGNTCRSPMAEALCQHYLPEVETLSAGWEQPQACRPPSAHRRLWSGAACIWNITAAGPFPLTCWLTLIWCCA